jgi:hypothetical protein
VAGRPRHRRENHRRTRPHPPRTPWTVGLTPIEPEVIALILWSADTVACHTRDTETDMYMAHYWINAITSRDSRRRETLRNVERGHSLQNNHGTSKVDHTALPAK